MSDWGSAVRPKSASQALQFQADSGRDGQARGREMGSLPEAKIPHFLRDTAGSPFSTV